MPRKPINFLDLVQRLSRKILQNTDYGEPVSHASVAKCAPYMTPRGWPANCLNYD